MAAALVKLRLLVDPELGIEPLADRDLESLKQVATFFAGWQHRGDETPLPNSRLVRGQPDLVITLVTEWRERHLLEGAPGRSDEDSDVNAVRINEIVNLLARTVATSAEGVVGQVCVLREQAEDTDYLKHIPGLLAGLTDSIIAGVGRLAGGAA